MHVFFKKKKKQKVIPEFSKSAQTSGHNFIPSPIMDPPPLLRSMPCEYKYNKKQQS